MPLPPTGQPSLFDDEPAHGVALPGAAAARGGRPAAAPQPAEVQALAAALLARWGDRLHLGTSSWHFPGWAGWIWDRAWPEATLSRAGLAAYAAHPLLRTVSLDRAFYRPLDAATYAALASQVPASFRFVVKAPALLSDALQRDPASGAGGAANPLFLDPGFARDTVAGALREGLGERCGALVLQISPLPARWLLGRARLHAALAECLRALREALPEGALVAVEVRDTALLDAAFATVLREAGARACLGLHDRLPDAHAQLPMQRALWPGDLVCRWNLQRGQRYAEARDRWAPFDRMQGEDEPTRRTLARVLTATLDAGHRAFVTINNKAEGCAPASVLALARALLGRD